MDAAAFAIFAIMRNDAAGFWQLAGPWSDVPHFNVAGASIAYAIYLDRLARRAAEPASRPADDRGAGPHRDSVPVQSHRHPRRRLAHARTRRAAEPRSFPARFKARWRSGARRCCCSAPRHRVGLFGIGTGRPATNPRLHALALIGAIFGALTPLIANLAQSVSQPILAIAVSAILAALAQAGLWSIVYVMTGLTLDLLSGKPPTFVGAYGHWRTGLVKGAIYGGVFMFLVLVVALPLREPVFIAFVKSNALALAPLAGALIFPLIADAGRQRRRHAAVLRPSAQELPRQARLCARARRRERRRLGSRLRPQRGVGRRSVRRAVRRRRARLCRRRHCFRRRAHRLGRAAQAADLAALRARRADRRAASPARSAGISTPRRSMSWSPNSGPTPT